MKFCVLMPAVVVLMVCLIPDTQGRPSTEVKPKQKHGAHKKLRFKQWINWIVSLYDDAGDTDILRENLASLTVITDMTGSNVSEPPLGAMSPLSTCIHACVGNSSSVNVSALHQCNRDCMFNPHRYDVMGNSIGAGGNSGYNTRKRRYS